MIGYSGWCSVSIAPRVLCSSLLRWFIQGQCEHFNATFICMPFGNRTTWILGYVALFITGPSNCITRCSEINNVQIGTRGKNRPVKIYVCEYLNYFTPSVWVDGIGPSQRGKYPMCVMNNWDLFMWWNEVGEAICIGTWFQNSLENCPHWNITPYRINMVWKYLEV